MNAPAVTAADVAGMFEKVIKRQGAIPSNSDCQEIAQLMNVFMLETPEEERNTLKVAAAEQKRAYDAIDRLRASLAHLQGDRNILNAAEAYLDKIEKILSTPYVFVAPFGCRFVYIMLAAQVALRRAGSTAETAARNTHLAHFCVTALEHMGWRRRTSRGLRAFTSTDVERYWSQFDPAPKHPLRKYIEEMLSRE